MKQIGITFLMKEVKYSKEVEFTITTEGLANDLVQYVQLLTEGNRIRFRIQIPETQAELLEYAVLYGTDDAVDDGTG